ncbi:PREDICTED: serine/threonine-protein kinase EDR1-like isoform X2 [Ipomoea nil]|uniref:serine/threonine-protein kinase EDR1-like isoform X2 n=1 Tax=Ipomoea nil TaxID=35883 RepID=UPI000901FD0F|nr:PREDICTED: serine/threonine-protein kinase EDR1-like isoform X2 [Ipomoea nil]
MEEPRDDTGPSEASNSDAPWWPADFMEKLQSVSVVSSAETSTSKGLTNKHELESSAAERASQILWETGELAEPIPDGFYFVIPERRFKELFDTIPSLEDLFALDAEGLRPNVILVDTLKDKKLSMIKQLTLTLVKGLSSSPAAVIKKIAELVCDFYKRPKYRTNALEEVSHALGNQGIHMLCQMKSKPCHYQAILFKVLADTVGFECKLIVGPPREGVIKRDDSYEHICVTVVLNSVEFLVDLLRSPGKLIPYTSQALFLPHIRASRDIYSAESDSSPIEPNSPICLVSDQLGIEGISSGESIRPSYQHKLEASTTVSIPSLRNRSSSQTEPDVADSFWWHDRKKIISEHWATNPSPEHPLFRGHRRSVLGGQKYTAKGFSDDTSAPRSAGASPIEARRRRRRSVSMIPEISDNIVRAVRAMNEAVKQSRPPREQDGSTLDFFAGKRDDSDHHASALRFHRDEHDEDSGRSSRAYDFQRRQINSHKAISLPSSPQYIKNQIPGMADGSGVFKNPDMISRFDEVLESSKLVNKPLLPYEEWNIDFSEINIGIRVGIGFFGEVFRGIWNGIEVAVKVYLEQDLSTENIEDFANEISLLSRIRHPNVILFLGACTKPPRLSMVTEFMEMGSLYHLIHASGQKNKLSWRRRLKMLCDICS